MEKFAMPDLHDHNVPKRDPSNFKGDPLHDTLLSNSEVREAYNRFDVEEGETVEIRVEVLERGTVYNEVHIELETGPDGMVGEWSFPFGDVEQTYTYEASASAEHTLRVYGMSEAAVEVTVIEE